MEIGVSRLLLSVEMFIHRRYNRRRQIESCGGVSMNCPYCGKEMSVGKTYTKYGAFYVPDGEKLPSFPLLRQNRFYYMGGAIIADPVLSNYCKDCNKLIISLDGAE